MTVRYQITLRNGSYFFIDEPEGWDSEVTEFNRGKDSHGMMQSISGQNLKFTDRAAAELKAEYDTYGVAGELYITRQIECDGAWIDEFNGKFVFSSYRRVCTSAECYVSGLIDELGDQETIQNLITQQVNLDATKSFDETTNLPPYANLGKSILLPSKGIILKNKGENDAVQTTEVSGAPVNNGDGSNDNGNSEIGLIEFGLNKTVASEIGSFVIREKPFYTCLSTFSAHFYGNGCNDAPLFDLYPEHSTLPGTDCKILALSPIVNYGEGTANYGAVSGTIDLNVNLSASITALEVDTIVPKAYLVRLPFGATGENKTDYEWLYEAEGSMSVVYHDPAFQIQAGDRIYAFIWLYHYRTQEQTLSSMPAFSLNNAIGDFFRMDTLTHAPATRSKVYLINEVASRITESYTNGRVRVYSDYIGRTDSEPYATTQDGEASLTAVTNGIRVRAAENRIPGKPVIFAKSLQELINDIKPIYPIGWGMEPDPARPGYKRLRIEHWAHFYQQTVVLQCLNISKIERKVLDTEIYSTVRNGYQKYEAEQYNGLDEFLTERYMRTGITQVKNDLAILSTAIASGYASEITRRMGNLTSEDWRFDADTFIYCLQRGLFTINIPAGGLGAFLELIPGIPALAPGDEITIAGTGVDGVNGTYTVSFPITAGGSTTATLAPHAPNVGTFYGTILVNGIPAVSNDLAIELGNVTTPTNIVDPNTVYNWRIRPHYNLMRWFSFIARTWRQYDNNAALIFMDGKGNYHERGQMTSTFAKEENQPVAGDQKINKQLFADPARQAPKMRPEEIEYEYPIDTSDILAIKANPYGKIYYSTNDGCDSGYGWLKKLKIDRFKGTGKFTLIPEI